MALLVFPALYVASTVQGQPDRNACTAALRHLPPVSREPPGFLCCVNLTNHLLEVALFGSQSESLVAQGDSWDGWPDRFRFPQSSLEVTWLASNVEKAGEDTELPASTKHLLEAVLLDSRSHFDAVALSRSWR